jgi:hypothetical protein
MKNPASLHYFLPVGISALLTLGLAGCASSASHCTPSSVRKGYFCYGGINFGKVEDPLYKQGIRDGCRTGQGNFSKDYRLSGSSELYRQGWVRGRTLCRPRNWSDSPTYSYHPLPDRNSANPRSSMSETHDLNARERMIRYAESEAQSYTGSTASSTNDDRPETIRYP